MIPGKLVLDKHYSGDSWYGLDIGPATINGESPILPVVSARLQFRNAYDDLGYEFNTVSEIGKGLIQIVDATNWELIIGPQILTLPAGKWVWDLEITDSSGFVLTPVSGKMKVIGDVTNAN